MTSAAVIYAKDLGRLAAFYACLGLTIDESEPGEYVVLTGPGLELSIVQIPRAVADAIAISNPPQARERAPIKLAFTVPSIERALESTRPLGGRIKDDAKPWTFRSHSIQDAIDPEGNVYQLREKV